MVRYRWHPLYGQRVRRIQSERRASGELVHVELTPGAVTILPAWKLDAVYCAGLKVGAPQVSLAALSALNELLIACESRLVSADGNIVTGGAEWKRGYRSYEGRSLLAGPQLWRHHASSISFSTTCAFGP